MRRVTLCSAVRTAREARRTTATRRLERQRRGEVPPLVHGYVDVTSNYYTAYNSSSSVIRRLSSGTLKHHLKAKRPRASELRSVSEIDIVNDIQDSEGFADIVNSDDEASPPDDLPESMLKQVEAYLDLRLTSDSMPNYLDWDELDAPGQHDKLRLLDLNHEDVVAVNIEFCCRYMIRGFTWLFDLAARFPYESYETASRMFVFEMLIWCNMFCRMSH